MNLPRKAFRLGQLLLGYKRRKIAGLAPPIRIWIESSSFCNFRCAMCHNAQLPAEKKQHMSLDLFTRLIDEARSFAADIYLHHRGEPLLNEHLCEMIAYARNAGLRTRFHTNGSLLNKEKAAALLEAQPNLVSVSIDGFDKDAYEQIRHGGNFDTTVDNVLGLLSLRRERRLRTPYVVVERIRFRTPPPGETPEKIAALRRRLLDAGLDELIEKEEYVWATQEAPEPHDARAAAVCTFPWYATVVCADGAVTPCPQDFFAALTMGNINDATLREIWNGPAYQDLRRRLCNDLASLPLCRKCDRLCRKRVGGVPWQYLVTFLTDQFLGYGRLRRWIGTAERN